MAPSSSSWTAGNTHDALAVARRRCWRQDWVLDIDVRAFFDSVPHDLLLKAVAHHTDERWVLLYIERWLKAPMQMADGTLVAREKGTPQGGLCSAGHNPPYEQRRIMPSAGLFCLVRGGLVVERCA